MDNLVYEMLSDDLFEKKYFSQCQKEIHSLTIYKELCKLVENFHFSIHIKYTKYSGLRNHDEYALELGVLDSSGKLYHIPNPYDQPDELACLLVSVNILTYNHKKKNILFYNWKEELVEELVPIVNYLQSLAS